MLNIRLPAFPFIKFEFLAMVILYVAAVPDASNTYISSPTDGDGGRVRVLAAEVSTKYL